METKEHEHALDNARGWLASIREAVKGLDADVPECDDAHTAILESALSVEVRTDWHEVGKLDSEPHEFCVLLTTGGPALRLIGTLADGGPDTVRMEWQDWGTPWTEHRLSRDEEADALTFCRQFYFGDF